MSYRNIEVEPAKMSTRGQIVIPQDIRERLGLKKDALFMVGSLDSETIILKRMDKVKLAAEFLKLRKELLQRSGGLSKAEIEAEIDAVRKKN